MISKLRDSISPEKGFVYIVYRLYVTWWFNQFDQVTILQPWDSTTRGIGSTLKLPIAETNELNGGKNNEERNLWSDLNDAESKWTNSQTVLTETIWLDTIFEIKSVGVFLIMENISHSSNDSNNLGHDLIEPQVIWYWTIKVIIAFLAIVGNGIVIFLIVSKRRLRVTNNWFVLSLAIADFCIGLITTSTGILCTFGFQCDWRLQIGVYNFLLYTSTLNLWAMAIDRYVGIVHPLRYMSLMTFKRASAMIAMSWFTSFLAAFVRLFWLYGRVDKTIDRYYRMVIDLLFGVFSCVMLVTVYGRIFYICREKLRQSTTQIDQVIFNHSSSVPQRLKKARRNASAEVLGLVILLFVICYSLSIYVSFCFNFDVCHLSRLVVTIALLLVHLNSAVNFVVYALMKKDIRQELQRFWRPMRCDNPVHLTECREVTLV